MVCVDLEKSQEKTEGGQMLLLLCISAIRRIKCDTTWIIIPILQSTQFYLLLGQMAPVFLLPLLCDCVTVLMSNKSYEEEPEVLGSLSRVISSFPQNEKSFFCFRTPGYLIQGATGF